jgi:hypothetical protein
MPYPIYHLGPSGFLGFLLRRWIDLPVFLLVNIPVDVEVLFAKGWPYHQYWHFHSLLVGGIVGAVFGLIVYGVKPLRCFLEWVMRLVRIPYKANVWKMITAGVLGVWLHAFLDSIYHYDVQLFWPSKAKALQRPMWRALGNEELKLWCLMALVGAGVLYMFAVRAFYSDKGRVCEAKAKDDAEKQGA